VIVHTCHVIVRPESPDRHYTFLINICHSLSCPNILQVNAISLYAAHPLRLHRILNHSIIKVDFHFRFLDTLLRCHEMSCYYLMIVLQHKRQKLLSMYFWYLRKGWSRIRRCFGNDGTPRLTSYSVLRNHNPVTTVHILKTEPHDDLSLITGQDRYISKQR
jgi:hypothetical protein